MKSIFIICLIALASVLAEFPVAKENGGKNTKTQVIFGVTVITTTILTDKYFMVYTASSGLEVNLVYDEKRTTYKPKKINKEFGGIKNNAAAKSQLSELGCKSPKDSVISYTWLENNCKKAADRFNYNDIPEEIVLGKKKESDSVAYKIDSWGFTDEDYKIGNNIDLNNEIENTLKPNTSSTLIPGLMVLIMTLGLLLF